MIFKYIKLAIIALKINKMRSLLTMLGIIIGIAAVIAIVNIGNSMTASISENFNSFGASNITAYVQEKSDEDFARIAGTTTTTTSSLSIPGMSMGGGGMTGGGMTGGGMSSGRTSSGNSSRRTTVTLSDEDKIYLEMLEDLKETFPDEVEAASVTYSYGQGTAYDGDLYANVSINGVIPDYEISNSTVLLEGRFINDIDLENNSKVAVVSDKFVENMFDNKNTVGYLVSNDPVVALGSQIKIYMNNNIQIYTIIGIYEYDDSSTMAFSSESTVDTRTDLLIPITTAQEGEIYKNHTQATITINSNVDVLSFVDEIQAFFDEYYRFNATYGISIRSMEEQLSTITESLSVIATTVALIAGISLLVGGIGIMNIMLVSVTERTREIGIRKALGAKQSHIKMQFITEAGIISAIGGLIGTLLGTIGGMIGANIMGSPPVISVSVVLISVLFSMAVGIFFGYYPAKKAALLNPIDALRYE